LCICLRNLSSTPVHQRVTSSVNDSFSSPPSNTRFSLYSSRNEESSDADEHQTTADEKQPQPQQQPARSPGYRDRGSRKRDGRKSPDQRGSNDRAYDDRDKLHNDGNSSSDKRGNSARWSRDRRNSYDRDRDRDRGGRWNNDNNDRWRNNRNNNWNDRNTWSDRNNRGGSRYGNNNNTRDNTNRLDNNRLSGSGVDENTWNNTGGNNAVGISHWSVPPPRPLPPVPPSVSTGLNMPPQPFHDQRLPPPPMMNNEQIPGPPTFQPMMTPNQPTNMMSIIPNQNMIPPPPSILNPLGVVNVMQSQVNQNHQQKPPVASQPYNSVSMTTSRANQGPPQPTYNPQASADVNTLNVVNQLLLLNAERLKQATGGGGGSHSSTPDNTLPASPHRNSSGSSPTRSKPLPTLPSHWKTATDADGRVYYYHTVTRYHLERTLLRHKASATECRR